MKKIFWLILVVIDILLIWSLVSPRGVIAPSSSVSFLDKDITYQYINEYRQSKGLNPLVESSLCEYAKERSEEIITDWSHDQWVEDGIGNIKRYSSVCPECENMAENLAREAIHNEELMDAWKSSPGHNGALLDPKWEIMCMGITWKNEISYIALEFGDIDGK